MLTETPLKTYRIDSSMRLRALLYFMGWQGGTIHQIAGATGLRQEQILDEPLRDKGEDDASGWFAMRTCDRSWRAGHLAPKYQGDWLFFSVAIRAFWATGPLDGLNDRWPNHPTNTGLMRCVN